MVVDVAPQVLDGGRCGTVGARRWSMWHRGCQTVVDLAPWVPDGGRSADISSACR